MRRGRPYRRGQLTSYRWQKLRLRVIKEEPLCTLRLSCCTRWSTTADHIIPVSHRPDLKYMRGNLRGSCQRPQVNPFRNLLDKISLIAQ